MATDIACTARDKDALLLCHDIYTMIVTRESLSRKKYFLNVVSICAHGRRHWNRIV